MTNFNPELIAKSKTAKSAEELFELTKANNVELTEDEAKTYFAQLNANGAVADDELEDATGGFNCGSENDSETTTTDSALNMDINNEQTCSKLV